MQHEVTIFRDGRPVMRSKNLAAIVRYAKERAELVAFGIQRPQSGLVHGYKVRCEYEDGALCDALFMDWRVAVDFFARGARRTRGPFPSDLRVLSYTPAEHVARFETMRDIRKGSGCLTVQAKP